MIQGFVEAFAEHEARGWAYDDTAPHEHLVVSAWLDGAQVGTSLADVLRPDLRNAGIGHGDHEFRIAVHPLLTPASLGRLEIRAESARSQPVALQILPGRNQSRADQASDASIPFRDESQFPLFILGPARSGTSALALALLKSGRYEGYGEGHLMPLAQQLLSVVDRYYADRDRLSDIDTALRSVHTETFQRSIRRSFVQLTRAAYPTRYWLDKTPTAAMVRTAPLLREIYPNARFIFMKRRVIENILSRRRKFPQDTLENHYLDWVDVLTAWLEVRDGLGTSAIELDQIDMARGNDAFAAQVGSFLDLPPDQTEMLRRTLASDHPEQTSEQVGLSTSIEGLGLHPNDERELRTACDKVMDAFGYVYSASYRM